MTLVKKYLRTVVLLTMAALPMASKAQNAPKIKITSEKQLDLTIKNVLGTNPKLLNPVEKQGLLEMLRKKGIVEQKEQSAASDTTGWQSTI